MSNIEKEYVDYSGLQEYDGLIKGVISTDFVGATSSTDGVAGRVPAPDAGDENNYLRGDGTWSPLAKATASTAGIVKPDGTTITVDSNGVISSTSSIQVDDEFDSTSENPLQNKVITNIIPDKGHGNTWVEKTWVGSTPSDGSEVWTDGIDVYYWNQLVLNRATSTWVEKTWYGLTSVRARYIWTDGENVYYSSGTTHYVLDRATSTWESKTWYGLTDFDAGDIWVDGDNVYCSYNDQAQYVLNKSTSTWESKTWYTDASGSIQLIYFAAGDIWTDGDDIYLEDGANRHFVLDRENSTWHQMTWNGLERIYANAIWTDGNNIYHSVNKTNLKTHHVLDKSTHTWNPVTWNIGYFSGDYVWTDGDDVYFSYGATTQYVLPRGKGFGTAAAKDYTNAVTSESEDVVTSGGVYSALDEKTRYMIFKGTPARWAALSSSEKAKYADGLIVLSND